MKISSAVMALALLVPVAGNAAKDHSIELTCEKLKVTLFDKRGAIFLGDMSAKNGPSKVDNVQVTKTTAGGLPALKTDFVEYAEMGGTYSLYHLITFDDGGPAILVSEYLDADDNPIRKHKEFVCEDPVEKMQAMPNIQSIGEMRGQ